MKKNLIKETQEWKDHFTVNGLSDKSELIKYLISVENELRRLNMVEKMLNHIKTKTRLK